MSKNILHISDLHLEEFDSPKGVIKTRFQESNFKTKFFNKVNETFDKIDYVFITGDLANKGTEDEYKLVEQFLLEIIQQLGVNKEDIFIIPGNHDINWKKCETAFHKAAYKAGESGESVPKEENSFVYHTEKFEDFSKFYNSFYDNKFEFNPVNSIFRDIDIEVDGVFVKLCSINSCYKESHFKDNHFGFINHSSLESRLKESDEKILKFALMHHIPIVLNNDKSIVNWDDEIKFLCVENNIRVFVFGHQHKSQSTTIISKKEEFIEFSVGTLGKLDSDVENTFNVMSISYSEEEGLLNLKNTPFQYIRNSGEFKWIKLDDDIEEKKIKYQLLNDKPKDGNEVNISKEIIPEPLEKYTFPERLERFSEKLLEIVQKNNLYKSGHYHWNPTTRTLGFIDTNKLLSKRVMSLIAKGSILQSYNIHEIDSDYVIGLGQEGITLGGFLSRDKGIPFTSIPYLSRKDDHSKPETELRLNGSRKVSIVTDVIFSASSIKRIIDAHPKNFKSVEEITLFSIFYISSENEYHPDMFKGMDSRIKFFTSCDKIKIDKCKYSDDEFCDCPIYYNKLEKVHEFYAKPNSQL